MTMTFELKNLALECLTSFPSLTVDALMQSHRKIQDAAAKKELEAQKGSFDVSDVYTRIYTCILQFI